ncbi:MAG: 4Fe-4S binding protein, partial [Butyrivibrio sp.]|nr:4Fe-4S binding protein [Butyrivibrio sp.]
SHKNHGLMEERNVRIAEDFSALGSNTAEGAPSARAVVTGGVSYMHAREFLKDHPEVRLIRVATPFPFPEAFLLEALQGAESVLCLEELSPYLEEQLLQLAGKHGLALKVYGKHTGHVPHMGENSADSVATILRRYLGITDSGTGASDREEIPPLPARPPVLCAGCPHRASFYAVKKAMEGRKTYYCGDIGCYTLGNAMPLDMVDTCLCMGAGVTMAQGFAHLDREGSAFAFIGDSTFFASGITGVINAVCNEADITVCILDNSTTAMTGHQPHPGTGRNMMGHTFTPVSIRKILEGIGLSRIETVDPLDLEQSVRAVRECAQTPGVKAIIFKSPCIAIERSDRRCVVTDACVGCRKCILETGCPALTDTDGRVTIDASLCTGCTLCMQVCPMKAIGDDSND